MKNKTVLYSNIVSGMYVNGAVDELFKRVIKITKGKG